MFLYYFYSHSVNYTFPPRLGNPTKNTIEPELSVEASLTMMISMSFKVWLSRDSMLGTSFSPGLNTGTMTETLGATGIQSATEKLSL